MAGKHAAIVSLAYSGPKHGLIASADFNGGVLLIDARSMECVWKLLDSGRDVPSRLPVRLNFLHDKRSERCFLTYTGVSDQTSGAITVWDFDRAQKLGKSDTFDHNCKKAPATT